MEKLRQGPVLHLGVKVLDDDDDDDDDDEKGGRIRLKWILSP
jgi:hypothetical protein